MLAELRQRQIMKEVLSAGGVRVRQLARSFRVTEETIRRDLEKLEKEGVLTRIHGGALAKEDPRQVPYIEREGEHILEKNDMAAAALQEIREGDTLFLDASSTAFQVARHLPDIPLTVFTNSLMAMTELCDHVNVEVISTGGTLDKLSLAYVGPLAERMATSCQMGKAFLSCKGVDLVHGLSEASSLHASIKKCMIDMADKVYLMVDHSKFTVKSVFYFAQVTEIDVMITDRDAPKEVIKELESLGVTVRISD
jgi:DeoR/GlpR family transcriptional regulator of sugar metabolism